MLKVSKLREPVRGTALGKGPTAQAVGQLMTDAKKHPLIKAVFDFITFEREGRKVIAARPVQKVQELTRLPSQIGAAAGVAGSAQAQE